MKLDSLNFIKLLPQFMQSDEAVSALAESVDFLSPQMLARIKLLSVWNKIDDLNNKELDELAWELNIHWYREDADIEIKRALIKDSDLVHAKLGTKWAVERVIETYFGKGRVIEWFDYEGTHHRFKVHTQNTSVTTEQIQKFTEILEKVKRKSAILDGIIITYTNEMPLYIGIVMRKHIYEQHLVNPSVMLNQEVNLYGGIIIKEYTFEKHNFEKVVPISKSSMPLYVSHIMRERIIERYNIKNQ